MALDGITTAAIVSELKKELLGGRIDKIYQPLHDEIIFTVRSIGSNYKILASANSSHPRMHITNVSKDNPASPPMFCMILRKHIAGGKITNIYQPNFERIIILEVQSMNEMGDMTAKKLILEIMGKHSNLILTDENNKILDAIKRISHDTSSVREVLPGKEYVYPPSQDKKNPLDTTPQEFDSFFHQQAGRKLQEFLYKSYTGISPVMASEICLRAGLDPSNACEQISIQTMNQLYSVFENLMLMVKEEAFEPQLITQTPTQKIIDFSVFFMNQYQNYQQTSYESISVLLEDFYSKKDNAYHIQQKASDMRRLILTNIDRCIKKKQIQEKTLKDIADREVWKLKGELLTANIYAIPQNATVFRAVNYYEEAQPEIEIAIDPTKSPSENAQKYYNKYNKAKRTLAALEIQKKQNEEELLYLESVLNALENAKDDADLREIRAELAETGFIKKRNTVKKGQQKAKKSKAMHYISSQGYDIYIGKSNIQNDELTMHFADSNDLWFHTKNIPGSHVILQTKGTGEAPDETLLEAAHLAAYYSKSKHGSNVPVDYTLRKNIKKPNGSKPGFVIYEQNKTIYITPEEEKIMQIKNE